MEELHLAVVNNFLGKGHDDAFACFFRKYDGGNRETHRLRAEPLYEGSAICVISRLSLWTLTRLDSPNTHRRRAERLSGRAGCEQQVLGSDGIVFPEGGHGRHQLHHLDRLSSSFVHHRPPD